MAFQRIRRIGVDAVTNYSFQQTSAYDDTDPAATTAAWGTPLEIEAMDQPLTDPIPPATEVTSEGALFTFARFPFRFEGGIVKVRPTYALGDAPFLELWTQDITSLIWTLHRRISIADPVNGQPSGEAKFYLMFTSASVVNVAQVWITMDPGTVGTPTMRFACLQLFGRCDIPSETPDCPPGEECEPLPPIPDDNDPVPPGFPAFPAPAPPWPGFCEDHPELCKEGTPPVVDFCDLASIDAFRALLTPAQELILDEILLTMVIPCESQLDPEEESPNVINDPPTTEPPLVPRILQPRLPPERPAEPDGSFITGGDTVPLSFYPFFIFPSTAAKTAFEGNIASIPNDRGWKDFVDFWQAEDPTRFIVVPMPVAQSDLDNNDSSFANTYRFRLAQTQDLGTFAGLRIIATNSTGPTAPYSIDADPFVGSPGLRGLSTASPAKLFHLYQSIGGNVSRGFRTFSTEFNLDRTEVVLTGPPATTLYAKSPDLAAYTRDADWNMHVTGRGGVDGPKREFSIWRFPNNMWFTKNTATANVMMTAIVGVSLGAPSPTLITETNF